MKIRNGFVSNSSSSSFMITTKIDNFKDLEEYLTKIFALPDNHLLKSIEKSLVKVVIDNAHIFKTVDDIKDNYGRRYIEEDPEEFELAAESELAAIKDGNVVFSGEFDDNEGYLESFLCNTHINYKDDIIKFSHAGGY